MKAKVVAKVSKTMKLAIDESVSPYSDIGLIET